MAISLLARRCAQQISCFAQAHKTEGTQRENHQQPRMDVDRHRPDLLIHPDIWRIVPYRRAFGWPSDLARKLSRVGVSPADRCAYIEQRPVLHFGCVSIFAERETLPSGPASYDGPRVSCGGIHKRGNRALDDPLLCVS